MLLLERAGGSTELDDAGKALAKRFELGELAMLTQRMGDIDFKVKHATISQLPLEIAIVEGALRGQQQVAAPAAQVPHAPAVQSNAPSERVQNSPQQDPYQAPAPQQPRNSLLDRVRGGARGESAPVPAPQRPAPQHAQPQAPVTAPVQETRPAATDPQPVEPAPVSQPVYTPPAVASSGGGAIRVDVLAEGWPRIRADVKAVSRRIEAILQQIDPVAVNGNQLILVSPYEFHKNRVNTDEVRQIIEDVIERQYKVRVTVQCMTRNELDSLPRPVPAPAAAPTSVPTMATPPDDIQTQPPVSSESVPVPVFEAPAPEQDPAPVGTTDPPPVIDTSRQSEAIRNIFDAEEEQD
jgi:DNA polymerase III subunit gamma/tau